MRKKHLITLALVAVSLTVGLFLQYAHGQTNQTESKNFFECYTSWSGLFLFANAFTPTNIDLTDPEVKALLSNLCNFFHEKTGKWINAWTVKDDPDFHNETLSKEFAQKYGGNIPDSIKELGSMFKEDNETK